MPQWTGIQSATVNLSGKIKAAGKKGNGLTARIMRPSGEILSEWKLQPSQNAPTKIKNVQVKQNDELWFVIDSRGDAAFDSFHWAPKISDAKGVIAVAKSDCAGPGLPPPAQLAQALLLSNEFFYLD